MPRATFNALVFPCRLAADGHPEYAIFKRSETTGGFWQAISGGGEDDETPLETAKRECLEEAGIPTTRCSSLSTLRLRSRLSGYLGT